MSDSLIQVKNLTKHFPVFGGVLLRQVGKVHAATNISFELKRGETLGLVGESGCGKSTIGRTLLKLYQPTSGQIFFEGREITEFGSSEMRELRRDMQIVFQDPYESLNSRHTVGHILEEPFIIHKMGSDAERKKWVSELLERVGLNEKARHKYPHEFSGGQRQRIGIARAIALKPKLIVCDEPVSALDVSIQSQILNLLVELQEEMGLSYIFIAHDLAVVKHVSDRVAVMYLGKVVELTSAKYIYDNPLHPYTQSLLSAIPIPDPTQRHERKTLEGDVPSPRRPPSGCHFHTRCPFAKEICKEKDPLLEQHQNTEKEHQVACHFAGEIKL